MKIISFFLILFLFAAGSAAGQTECSVSAYVKDSDPKGLNVRMGAGTTFKAIGRIPFSDDGTMVNIIASNGKWVKISGAQNAEGKRVFSKSGWVFAPTLAISIVDSARAVNVWSTHSKKGSIVSTLAAGTEYMLESCKSDWIKVTIKGSGKPFTGWLPPGDHCGNPWNSCS